MCSQRWSSSTTSNMVPSWERPEMPSARARRMYHAFERGAVNSYAGSQSALKQQNAEAVSGRSWRTSVWARPMSTAVAGS